MISVLIVDDDDLVGQILAECCDEPDIDVVGVVAEREAALAAAAGVRPDVVLIDVRLAGHDGVEIAREILALIPAVKVIVVTADPGPDVELAALEAGCWGCIGKTMAMGDALPDLIRHAIGDQ